MADLEVIQKRENPLLKRIDVSFRIQHPKEKTPQRTAVRDKVAAAVGGKRDGVIVSWMRSQFGAATTVGVAKVYESVEVAKKTEPVHVLIRHGLAEKAKKTEGAAPAKQEAAKPAAEKKK